MWLAPNPPLTVANFHYSDGVAGVQQTIGVMRQLVKQFKVSPDMRQAATSIVFLQPEKDDLGEVNTVFENVRDSIRYVRDICDVETISTPDKTLQGRIGDCDDKAVLLATLLECIGYRTRFVVTGYYYPDSYEHVYLQVLIPVLGQWVDADATEPQPLGYAPPNPVACLIENVH